ncbi:hypothetical protein NQ317_008713 [Molorchus minor]|uniref:CCHC-type domain-containing protein n=1 Tax=Molorchus minor TaxID=1323400 RepID=A0ABQ9JF65_9CUCU|nr:hypothetical protein NQ317_008713 [Molorchus minor]
MKKEEEPPEEIELDNNIIDVVPQPVPAHNRFGDNAVRQALIADYFFKACCTFCKGEHYIQDCAEFLQLDVNDRIENVKKLRLCINCLRPGHMVKQCRSSSCRNCKSRHNSLLHLESPAKKVDSTEETKAESVNLSSQHLSQSKQVLLSTVLVRVFDKGNKPHMARALLDMGSQSSFITAEFCDVLQLNRVKVDITVGGLNQAQSDINFVPQITGSLPNFKVDLQSLRIPSHIKLADPNFHIPDKVDLLIGADCFWETMCLGVECDLPDVSNIIRNHFYVDDMLTGGSTVQEVVYITNEVTRTLARGGFKLRKFVSNDPRILQGIESQVGQTNAVDFGINENTKTLGMIWNGHSDSFLYKISDSGLGKRVTKRGILSEVSQIFDPLGFLSPCIILAKIILQNLWCERVTHQKIYLKKDAVPSLSFGGNEESDSEKENQQASDETFKSKHNEDRRRCK